jgi:hypothetical protein
VAIKLLWVRERIEALLRSGCREEALALACEQNVICEGAAFVAWDEAEQVAVAAEEIVQPSMMPAGAQVFYQCASNMAPPAPGDALSFCRRSMGESYEGHLRESEPEDLVREREGPIEQALESLRLTLPERKEIRAWAGEKGSEKVRFDLLMAVCRIVRSVFVDALLPAAIGEMLRRALLARAPALPAWTQTLAAACLRMLALRQRLLAAGATEEFARTLLESAVGGASIDEARLTRIEEAVAQRRVPLLAGARRRYWASLLQPLEEVAAT